MKVALTSDLHLGMSSKRQIRAVFRNIFKQKPDVVVIAGDNCGNFSGSEDTITIFNLARKVLPSVPILACLGNHDYWEKGLSKSGNYSENIRPDFDYWINCYENIIKVAEDLDIHLFEKKGLARINGITFAGHGLWYNKNPNTKDKFHMPNEFSGTVDEFMNKVAEFDLKCQIDDLNKDDVLKIFVSHFPVVEIAEENAPWCANPEIGDFLIKEGFQYFLNGHSHQNRSGPLRWESGSEDMQPRFKIIHIKKKHLEVLQLMETVSSVKPDLEKL